MMRLLPLLFLIALIACDQDSAQQTKTSVYHWKSVYTPDSICNSWIQQQGISRWYVRYFDVDMEERAPAPVAVLQNPQQLPDTLLCIPVVFITNRSLLRLPAPRVQTLADSIITLLQSMHPSALTHLQLDCDWSPHSQTAYFYLLDRLKAGLPQLQELSATLRLHQWRSPDETGVPPVDRVTLMYYNMGKVTDTSTQNSILDNAIGSSYLLSGTKYPLPVDVALPLFRWAVVFRRGRLVHLLSQSFNEITKDTMHFASVDEQHFVVVKATFREGVYLYPGDRIRLEEASSSSLLEAANTLANALAEEDRYLIYYHLDAPNIATYAPSVFNAVSDRFR